MQKQTTLTILLSLLPCIQMLHGSYNIKSTRESGYSALSKKQQDEKALDARSFNGGLDQSVSSQLDQSVSSPRKPSLTFSPTARSKKLKKAPEIKSPKTVREIMNAAITAAKIA